MKSRIYYLIVTVLLIVSAFMAFKPAVLFVTQKVLQKRFALDAVSIESIEFKSLDKICLRALRVAKGKSFSFQAKEIHLRLNFLDSRKGKRLKVIIESALMDVKQPRKTSIDHAQQFLLQKPSKGMLSELEFLDFRLNVQFKDLQVVAKFSANMDLTQQKVNSLYLNISSLKYRSLSLENVLLWAERGHGRGEFMVAKVLYDKAVITETNSLVRFENQSLIFYDLSAKVFGGKISGNSILSLTIVPDYQVQLQLSHLDISRFVEDFELGNKFVMTGRVNGDIFLQGQGGVINDLRGDFITDDPGGRLMIKDVSFFDHVAYRSSLDGFVESLQEYYYDTGFVKLSLQETDLLADVRLNGKQGRRDFNIVLHQ